VVGEKAGGMWWQVCLWCLGVLNLLKWCCMPFWVVFRLLIAGSCMEKFRQLDLD